MLNMPTLINHVHALSSVYIFSFIRTTEKVCIMGFSKGLHHVLPPCIATSKVLTNFYGLHFLQRTVAIEERLPNVIKNVVERDCFTFLGLWFD